MILLVKRTLGERIKYLREKNGYAQKFVAEKIGVKNNTLSSYESDKRQPDFSTLEKIADFFEVSVDYLLGRTESPDPQKKIFTSDTNNNGDENLFFFDIEGLSEDDIEEVKKHIEFLRFKAKEHNENNK